MTVRAAVLRELGGRVAVEDVALDPCGPEEVVVRIDATSVCITDALSACGHVAAAPPTMLGHAAVGVVEEAGARVHRARVGDRVVVTGTPECGECYWCVRDQPAECEAMLAGMVPPRAIGTLADGTPLHADGGVGTYGERTKLRQVNVVPIDSPLEDDVLSLLGCGVTTGVGAVLNLAEVQAGSSVAVVGCGPLGLWMVQGARVAGAERIVAIEPDAARRALAGELGATDLVDPAGGDPVAQVRALTGGRGADYVLEAAGPPEAVAQAVAMTRAAGTVVPSGWTTLDATVTLPMLDVSVTAKRIIGCQYGGAHTRRDIPRFARMLERGLLDPAPLLSGTFPLAQAGEVLEAARRRELLTAVLAPS